MSQHPISRSLAVIIFSLCLVSCVNISKKKAGVKRFRAVKISNVFNCKFDIRSINVNQKHVFFAGSKGHFGYLNTADNSIAYSGRIKGKDSLTEFRASAKVGKINLIMSAGNPALIYKVNYFGKRKRVYHSDKPGIFYDAMAFWNQKEGLIVGDPTEDCLSFATTKDGGKHWQTIDCKQLPKAKKGEAAFAASNSNIAIYKDYAWVISGGKASRVYKTADKGKTWKVFDTPLIQNKTTTGGYSIDFYNDKLGIIVGGDYTDPQNNHANKALTTNGGKSWQLIADHQLPGYVSCVKFVPHSKGQEIVAVGKTGIFYSYNRGESWTQLSSEGFYTIDFLNDFTAYAAGQGKIAKLTFIENGFAGL